jgi:hypothetical protein
LIGWSLKHVRLNEHLRLNWVSWQLSTYRAVPPMHVVMFGEMIEDEELRGISSERVNVFFSCAQDRISVVDPSAVYSRNLVIL